MNNSDNKVTKPIPKIFFLGKGSQANIPENNIRLILERVGDVPEGHVIVVDHLGVPFSTPAGTPDELREAMKTMKGMRKQYGQRHQKHNEADQRRKEQRIAQVEKERKRKEQSERDKAAIQQQPQQVQPQQLPPRPSMPVFTQPLNDAWD